MNTNATPEPPQQVAVWYFVAATFVFAAPSLFFADSDLWLRIAIIVVGFALVVAGGIQLAKELAVQRRRKTEPRPDAPQP